METDLDKIAYLCSMIMNGVITKDKDSVRSHLEDLNYFIQEKHLGAE